MGLMENKTGRRAFLKGAAVAGAGLVIGFHLDPRLLSRGIGAAAAEPSAEFVPNAFIRIAPDNSVTVLCKHIEFGQGPFTGFATIVADELDASPDQIKVEHAPADVKKYANLLFGSQGTGGSTAMANSWDQLRQAGAEARARLIAAAAETWKVPAGEIAIDGGIVKHPSGKAAQFGELVDAAQAVPAPAGVKPKAPSQWRYIGKGFPRVDTKPKTDGSAIFTIDVKLPDMLTCVVARPTRFGAKVKSFDAGPALAVKGVAEVFAIPTGVAVLAKGYWQAKKGAEALKIEWDEAGTEARSSAQMVAEYKELAKGHGTIARNDGDAPGALAKATKVVEATFTFPYLAHAPMEPNDCVIRRTRDGVELIFGSQLQTGDQFTAAAVLGLKPEQVAIKTMLAGGSFGRRATPASDMAAEAAYVLKAAKHQGPVKIVWSREDDIRGGRYRPLFVHRLKARDRQLRRDYRLGAGARGAILRRRDRDGKDADEGRRGRDHDRGRSRRLRHPERESLGACAGQAGVPTLWWRSVGHTHTAYATEAFLDQVAAAGRAGRACPAAAASRGASAASGRAQSGRGKGRLGNAAAKGRRAGRCRSRKLPELCGPCRGGLAGEDGMPKVERVVAAVDCGQPINPDVIRAQIEGGMGFAVSAAYREAIDLEDGRVVQSNFDGYQPLRIGEMPKIEVYIVPSDRKAHGHRRAGRPHHRARHRQRLGEAHRQADLRPAVRPLRRQGLRNATAGGVRLEPDNLSPRAYGRPARRCLRKSYGVTWQTTPRCFMAEQSARAELFAL